MTNGARGVAVVTGGGSGIGREVALALARRGHRLALLGRRPEPLAETLARLPVSPDAASPASAAFACDVRDPEALGRAAAEIEARFGAPEVLVPAAGVAVLRSLEELSPEDFQAVLATNLTGVFLTLRAFLPGMRRQQRGWIFPLLSVAARRGFPGWSAYCASKWGLAGLLAALREE
ncbi:MAG TPA: SDR family oxidoreductase, partial [Thermoanaerobaculia bacterium]|nr:SDR family oxidoreductase [Thermoanaerobaculia bacterium]